MNPVDLCRELLCEYKCSVCLDAPELPVTTPCGHTFCEMCLQQALSVVRGQGSVCPLCRYIIVEGVPKLNIAAQAVISKCQAVLTQLAAHASQSASTAINDAHSLEQSLRPPVATFDAPTSVALRVLDKIEAAAVKAFTYGVDVNLISLAREHYSESLATEIVRKFRDCGFTVVNLEQYETAGGDTDHMIRIAWRQVVDPESPAMLMHRLAQRLSATVSRTNDIAFVAR